MRRRPQPNPRRGLLRAAIAVLILTAVLLAIILAVSSITAPPAKAPIVPPSPGPVATPAARPTAGPAHAATPGPATPGKKRTLGLVSKLRYAPTYPTLLMTSGKQVVARAVRNQSHPWLNEVAAPDGRHLVYFTQTGDVYSRNPLFLTTTGGVPSQVGYGDPLVRPAWSPDGRYLLYVRVSPTRAFPGARWSLVQLDIQSRRSKMVARINAMGLTPLGWSSGRALFFVANTTDTSVYQVVSGRASFLTIVMPQPIITAVLSPSGRYIAFGAPTNCAYCTVDVYDLDQFKIAVGPTGMPQEQALAWTADGSLLVAQLGHSLAVIRPSDASPIARFSLPAHSPQLWAHPMVARLSRWSLELIDSITRQTYRSKL